MQNNLNEDKQFRSRRLPYETAVDVFALQQEENHGNLQNKASWHAIG
jgi:hypothetical protein